MQFFVDDDDENLALGYSLHIPSSHRIASPFTLTLYTRKEENQGIIWSNYQILNANLSSRESIICYVKSRERAGSTSASEAADMRLK